MVTVIVRINSLSPRSIDKCQI